MKWRSVASQNSYSPPTPQNKVHKRTMTPQGIQFFKPRAQSIANQSLDTISIDLKQNININSCRAKVIAVIEQEQRLKNRASQFISKIAKEKNHLMGMAVLRKKQEEESRQIKMEIQRCENKIKDEQELIIRRQKASEKISFFQRRAKERHLDKVKTRRHKTMDQIEPQSIKNVGFEHHIKNKKQQQPNKNIESFGLKNSIYLDEQQKKIEQTRKMLLHLSSMIDNVQTLRSKC